MIAQIEGTAPKYVIFQASIRTSLLSALSLFFFN